MEGLTPQQKKTMREFGGWLQQRPHLTNMRFEDAFALYKQDNPGAAPFAIAAEAGSLPASSFAPNMFGD